VGTCFRQECVLTRVGKRNGVLAWKGSSFHDLFGTFLEEHRIQHSVADARNKNGWGTLDAPEVVSLNAMIAQTTSAPMTYNDLGRVIDDYIF
jgi:hypothetical protein